MDDGEREEERGAACEFVGWWLSVLAVLCDTVAD
jgi:hypothetical protein